jgi:uncharacterized protein with beta-barrel porin domain
MGLGGCRFVVGSLNVVRDILHIFECEIGASRRRGVAGAVAFFACLGLAFFVSVIATAPASAQCQQTGSTVTCSGTDNDGFQAGPGVNQLTVDVQTGATVNNLGAIAISVNDLNTVTNNGAVNAGDDGTGISAGNNNTITNAATGTITIGDSVSVASFGIVMGDNNTLVNLGAIQVGTGCGCGIGGISAGSNNIITNVGPITGGDYAFGMMVGDGNTITNSGAISVGLGGVGISAGTGNTITNAAGGIITVGDSPGFGAAGIAVQDNNIVSNLGTIQVGSNPFGGFPPSGILGNTGNTITNGGSIIGGELAAGMYVLDNNVITNRGRITFGQDSVGIFAQDTNTITNAAGGIITVGDAVNAGAFGITAGNDNTITNLGQIIVGSDCGCLGVAGIAADSGNTIVNAGNITVGSFGFGIDARDGNTIVNNGTIKVGDNSAGVQLGSDNVFTNNGTVRAGAFGASVVSCGFCAQNNTVVNNGTLDGQISLEGSGHSVINNGLITVTAPGSPIGAPHLVDGSFTQNAAGTLALRVDNTNLSDTLTVTTANLGGTLRAVVQPGLYGSSTFYAGVVTATDPITTTFTQTTTSSAFFTATATYNNPNSVDLTLNRVPFGSVPGETQNQRNVGNYLEQNYSTNLTGNAALFFTALLQSPSLGVLDQLSGAGTTGAQHGAFSAGTMFNKAMTDQVWSWLEGGGGGASDFTPESTLLQYAASDKKRPEYKAFSAIRPDAGAFRPQLWRAWATAFGGSQSLRGDAVIGSPDASNRTFGGAGGFDYQVSPQLLLGFAAAGTSTEFSASSLSTSGRLEAGHLGVYGAYRWGATHVAGTLSYSHFENDTNRTISGVGPTETAKGQFSSDQFGGRLQVGHKFVFDRFAVTPFAAVQYMQLWQRAYTEASSAGFGVPGILGLSFQSRTVSSLPTFLGAEINTRIAVAHGAVWAPFVRASWVHEFMPDRTVAAAMSILPTGTFIVDGPRAARDAARIEAGSNLYLTKNIAVFGNFVGEYSGQTSSNAGNGGIRVSW